jgi:class 3 adenylate cyclase
VRELPRGTVTFLFTDIEGSTKLLRELGPDGYAQALAEHRRCLREAFAESRATRRATPSSSPSLREALALAHGLGINPYVRGCIDGLAAVSGADGDLRRCAFLRGVADRLCETTAELRTEQEEALYGRYVSVARDSLGDAQWSELRNQGRATPLSEAVEQLLEP